MPAVQLPEFWTAEMVRALPDDGKRYETVYGQLLMSPSARMWHHIVVRRLTRLLDRYVDQEPVGMVFDVGSDISWGMDTLVQPDIFVAPFTELRTLDWSDVRSLLLVAEVLSPGTAHYDRFAKRRLYHDVGVPLYWIVDADEHFVECWTPEATAPRVEHERIIWHPVGATAPCVIELSEIFKLL